MSQRAEERAELEVMDALQLRQALKATREELFQNRIRYATMALDSAEPLRKGRKRVSRILTYLRQRELAGE